MPPKKPAWKAQLFLPIYVYYNENPFQKLTEI